MRTLAIIGLLASSTTALAGVDKFVGSVDEVILAGTVEVPLVGDPSGETLDAMVGMTVTKEGEEARTFPVQLSGREAVIVVPQALVDELGLKKHTKKDKLGGTIDWVDIESLTIGGLELKGVRAMVQGSKSDSTISSGEVRIGMAALPELSYAILPSKGVVKFAPADQGATLVSEVGTAIPYTETPWGKVKFGKSKKLQPMRSLEVAAKVGGTDVTVSLDPGVEGSTVSPEAGVALEGGHNSGDTWHFWLDAEVGGASTSTWFYRNSALERGGYQHQGVLGSDAIGAMDIAVDQAGKTVALAVAKEQVRADIVPDMIAYAEKELEKALAEQDEAKEGEEAKASDEGDEESGKDPARAGAYAALAGTYDTYHRTDKAAETWAKVVELDDSSCTNWLSYGSAQLNVGDADGAIASFSKSSEQYHAWWDNDLETRKDMKKLANKGSGLNVDEEGKSTDPAEAPGACFVADGHLAQAMLVKGDLDGVEQAYRAHLDLDPGLALAYGNASLRTGEIARAHEALRQAMRLESGPDALNRLALGVAYVQQDDFTSATELFQRAAELDSDDPMAVSLWLDAVRRGQGNAAAADQAKAWATSRPDNAAAHLAWIQAASAAGDASEASTAGEALFNTQIAQHPRNASLQAVYARFLVVQGKLTEAAKAADTAVELNPGLGLAWLAKADVAAAQGDDAAAAEAVKTAASVASGHPAYALLLAN